MEHPDDRLRLMFTCCHPALEREDQIALTLHTLGGLTAAAIARAFLLPAPMLAQRLERAKCQIEEGHIPNEPLNFAERLPSVQAVIYLVFNEGYLATIGDDPVRRGLCAGALRLGRALCELLPNEPESLGLLALMLLQDSRRMARVRNQQLVTLEEQDRSLWDQGRLQKASTSSKLLCDAGRLVDINCRPRLLPCMRRQKHLTTQIGARFRFYTKSFLNLIRRQ